MVNLYNKIYISILNNFITILKKNNYIIYMYNKNFFIVLFFSKNSTLYIKNNYLIVVQNLKKFENKIILDFFLQFYFYKNIKIKFLGKGYKIKKKNNNSIIFFFNRSHVTSLWYNLIIVKKIKKRKILFSFLKYNWNYINIFKKIRYVSTYTKRGLKLSRGLFLKRKGKKT
jgi:hypothetical protein